MKEKKSTEILAKLAVCGGGMAVAVASCAAETSFAAPLGLLAMVLLSWGVYRVQSPVKWLYISGIFFHAVAFYWLPSTITLFGGFPYAVALALFLLYCLLSSLQFALCGYLFKLLNHGFLKTSLLAFPVSWIIGELFFPRMFPWSLIHPLVDWEIISTHAQFVGAWGLSFIVLWIVGVVTCWPLSQSVTVKRFGAFALFVIIIAGLFSVSNISKIESEGQVKVALIQGNVDAADPGVSHELPRDTEPYRRLSRKAVNDGAELLIWPESAFNIWVAEYLRSFLYERDPERQPLLEMSIPLLFGTLSYRTSGIERSGDKSWYNLPASEQEKIRNERKYFNSAFLIDKDKTVQGIYHKKILMPFGEYLPFAETFPSIKKLSPQSGDFAKGDRDAPLVVSIADKKDLMKMGVLICYEDLVTSLAREATLNGANILVNLTNDIWYGQSAAPYQHHLLARWRAIEVGRYLLRATNTGYTAVVDWRGKTIKALPIFSEGALIVPVELSNRITCYAKWGDLPLYLLLLMIIAVRLSPYSRD